MTEALFTDVCDPVALVGFVWLAAALAIVELALAARWVWERACHVS